MRSYTQLSNGRSIAGRQVPGAVPINKFGRNPDVDSGTPADIWDGGGDWVAPTAARIHILASDDAADADAGAGCNTLRVYGLTSWDSPEVSEDITMDGTSGVNTTNSYVIIHRMKCLTWGASGPNVGNISAIAAAPDGYVTAKILPSEGQTQMAVYGVCSSDRLELDVIYASLLRAASAVGNISLLLNPTPDVSSNVYLVKSTFGVSSTGSTTVERNPDPPMSFNGPLIVKMRADVSAVNCDVSAGFDGEVIRGTL